MKNVTITLDEQTASWARIEAARQDTSVSRLVGQMLRERMERDDAYDAAMRHFRAVRPVPLKRRSERYPPREALHERAGLR